MVILNCNINLEYYCLHCICDQINSEFVNRRKLFLIYQLQIFEHYLHNKYGIISGDFWHLSSTEESALI